jgi:hypothetical protein
MAKCTQDISWVESSDYPSAARLTVLRAHAVNPPAWPIHICGNKVALTRISKNFYPDPDPADIPLARRDALAWFSLSTPFWKRKRPPNNPIPTPQGGFTPPHDRVETQPLRSSVWRLPACVGPQFPSVGLAWGNLPAPLLLLHGTRRNTELGSDASSHTAPLRQWSVVLSNAFLIHVWVLPMTTSRLNPESPFMDSMSDSIG